MKITYKENPLETTIELDYYDRKILLLRFRIDDICNHFFEDHNDIENGDIDQVIKRHKSIDINYYDSDEYSDHLKLRLRTYEDDLKKTHWGGCTCDSSSCSKCHAESLLGIDTISGLGKYEGSRLYAVFCRPEVKTCAQAITYLENHPVTARQEWQLPHIERWNEERLSLVQWLKDYQTRHLE